MPQTKPIFEFLQGEIKAGKFFLGLGFALILSSFFILSFVDQDFLRGLNIPMSISGFCLLVVGGLMVVQNQKRTKEFVKEIQEDVSVFHFKETCRVQAFQAYSSYLKLFWSLWVILGFIIAWLPVGSFVFGLAFGCTLVGAFGQFTDIIQQKRVDSYLSTLSSFKGQIKPAIPA